MAYELLIQHGNKIQYPPVVEGVSIEWERTGQPGKMTFEVIRTPELSFSEGDPVCFSVNGAAMFYGFIFEKSHTGAAQEVIKVTAYDQLYYLKNKDTYVYADKTASEVVKMIAADFGLNLGTIENTVHKIQSRTEEDVSLADIIQNALDETIMATGNMYVLYDKAGKLTLQFIGGMRLGMVINKDTAGDFNYKTSIADQTYNKVKLSYENEKTGKREIYIAQDGSHINEWGVLQFFKTIDNPTNAKTMADTILKLYNVKNRSLKIKDALGDARVRAGTLLVVMLDLGDMSISNYLLVEQVQHRFDNSMHLMNLRLRGGAFVS